MKASTKLVLTAVAAAALVAPATAQYRETSGMSFRAGVYFAGGQAKAIEGRNFFTAGLVYRLDNFNWFRGAEDSEWNVSLDYYGKGSFSNVPVLLNYVGRTEAFYYSLGGGVGFSHTPGGSDTDFSYQLSVGRDFNFGSQPLFAELRYLGTTRADLSGFAVNVGIRF